MTDSNNLELGARYQASFDALKDKNEQAFIPFVMI